MKKIIFGALAALTLCVTSCISENKSDNSEKSYVDTTGPESGPGLDSGERGMDTSTVDSSQVNRSTERKSTQ